MNHTQQLVLKPGYSIFFGTVWFERKVATMGTGLGLTDLVFPFVIAKDTEDAEEKLRARYVSKPNVPEIRRITVSLALNQDIQSYIEPEKITGFSVGVLR